MKQLQSRLLQTDVASICWSKWGSFRMVPPKIHHSTYCSGEHHRATKPGPIVVWVGSPTHPPLMYWGRRSVMTLILLSPGRGDFLQIVGINVVIPSWVNVAIPLSGLAAIVGFPGRRWHFSIIRLHVACNKNIHSSFVKSISLSHSPRFQVVQLLFLPFSFSVHLQPSFLLGS